MSTSYFEVLTSSNENESLLGAFDGSHLFSIL